MIYKAKRTELPKTGERMQFILVYQGGIANIFKVDCFNLSPYGRNAVRVFQGTYRCAAAKKKRPKTKARSAPERLNSHTTMATKDFDSTQGTNAIGVVCSALFVPLRGEYFDAFERGEKRTEYRKRGPRWNAETCRIGRRVVLSRGYGKQRRLTGTITGFCYDTMPSKLPGWLECYGPNAGDAACITITLDGTNDKISHEPHK